MRTAAILANGCENGFHIFLTPVAAYDRGCRGAADLPTPRRSPARRPVSLDARRILDRRNALQ
jgi:hypothetical protein